MIYPNTYTTDLSDITHEFYSGIGHLFTANALVLPLTAYLCEDPRLEDSYPLLFLVLVIFPSRKFGSVISNVSKKADFENLSLKTNSQVYIPSSFMKYV